MKKIVFLFALLSSVIVAAQNSGEIIYEDKMDIHRRMTGDREQFREMVPQFRTEKMILTFNETEAMYIASPDEKDASEDVVAGRGGRGRFMRMRMMGGGGNNIVWLNHAEGQRVEQRDFMDKKFLIKGPPEAFTWKMTGESMQVGQYQCFKATYEDSTENVVAWFTPQIAVPIGPAKYGQLPGLILHIDINEGERTYTATEINLKEIDAKELKEPTKGKEVTAEEFQEIVHEKMKEMRTQNGGRGMIIRGG
jgi:GLPGLI family protein